MLNGEYIFGLGTKVAVEETSKMYKMTLVSLDMADWCPHIEMMFRHGVGDVICFRKRHGKHTLYDWGDDTFTIYPFRAGIPYYFVKNKGENK